MPSSVALAPVSWSLAEAIRRAGGNPDQPGLSVQAAIDFIDLYEARFGAARAAVDAWQDAPAKGVWPKLNRSNVTSGVAQRISNPWRVSQGPAPFCGPAAIAFELIRHDPVEYVRIQRTLWETGGFSSKAGFEVEASSSLRKQPSFSVATFDDDGNKDGTSTVPHADWLLLATLREAANLVLGVDTPESEVQGMTTIWEIIEWSRRILNLRGTSIHKAKPFGDLGHDSGPAFPLLKLGDHLVQAIQGQPIGPRKALQSGLDALEQGGSAFLMIHSRLLGDNLGDPGFLTQTFVPNFATHWVSLVDPSLGLIRQSNDPLGWSKAVALDGEGATTLRDPRSTIGDDEIELTVFSWDDVEYRRLSVQQVRHNLFAVATAV